MSPKNERMQILSVPNFEQMAAAIQGANGCYTLAGPEEGNWTAGTGIAGRVMLQVGEEGGANYYEGAALRDAICLSLPLGDPQLMSVNGHEADAGSLPIIRPNGSVLVRAKAANRSALVVLPVDLFRDTERFDSGDIAVLQNLNGVLAVDPRHIGSLRQLVRRFAATDYSLSPSAGRAAEEEFMAHIFAAVQSRTVSSDSGRGRPWVSRDQVLRKVRDLVASAGDRVLHVEDLCRVANVSERTLRTVFNETFALGPLRYLRHRRLHLVRAALRAAHPGRDTVASIAAEFGFWEFGRFAKEYKALFGELPSRTLLANINLHTKHDGIVVDRKHMLTAPGTDAQPSK